MARDDTTQIRNDGLRYKSKKGGSPFGTGGRSIDTMSCIKCGRHKPRSDGSFKRMLGSTMFICFDCKPSPAEIITAPENATPIADTGPPLSKEVKTEF